MKWVTCLRNSSMPISWSIHAKNPTFHIAITKYNSLNKLFYVSLWFSQPVYNAVNWVLNNWSVSTAQNKKGYNYIIKKLCLIRNCLFGFNIAFNFSVISWQCLVSTESSLLTFIMLSYWSIMPQTLDMITPRHIILTLGWPVLADYPVSLCAKQGASLSELFCSF